ncbi:MAG: hypothetical protein QOH13_2158 [Thermoleophilaceae bacterium]|jgi:hypothetical protein|nr:hypothetical protein [Thermoleophilaceae bacterium]
MKRVPKLFQISRIFRAPAAHSVHFHRGPQGQASPCYETACPIPQLSVEDVIEA